MNMMITLKFEWQDDVIILAHKACLSLLNLINLNVYVLIIYQWDW